MRATKSPPQLSPHPTCIMPSESIGTRHTITLPVLHAPPSPSLSAPTPRRVNHRPRPIYDWPCIDHCAPERGRVSLSAGFQRNMNRLRKISAAAAKVLRYAHLSLSGNLASEGVPAVPVRSAFCDLPEMRKRRIARETGCR